jgi:hypothetical protein
MFSVSWALSLLGMQQLTALFNTDSRNASSRCTHVFDRITEDAVQEFDESMKGIFRSGDKVQRRMIDLMFGGRAGRNNSPPSTPTTDSYGNWDRSPQPEPSQTVTAAEKTPLTNSSVGWGPMPTSIAK